MGVQGKMRDQIEKIVVLPFSMGCISQASIAVAQQRPRRSKSDFRSPSLRNQIEEKDEDSFSGESAKHSSRFLAIPRPNISTGVNRLVKGLKNLSQLFIDEDGMEELSMEMEIGCPTDVKHVTHIGWDGLANANPLMGMGWENLITPELVSHPTAPEDDSPTFLSLNASSSSFA